MPPYDPRAFVKLMLWSISFLLICTYLFAGEKILHSKIKNIEPHEVDGQYCFVKIIIKKQFWSVLMVKQVLIHQVIGNYLLSFITETFQLQNTVGFIADLNMLLNRSERHVYKLTANGR